MDIGEQQRVIIVEPLTVPDEIIVDEPVEAPAEPAEVPAGV